jgi:peptidyl-prolyl cis-trans isomerase C
VVAPAAAAPARSAEASPRPTASAAAVPATITKPPEVPTPVATVAVAPAPAAAAAPATAPATIAATEAPTGPATPTVAIVPASQPAAGSAAPPVRDASGKLVDAGKIVITVGDETVTAGDFDGFISELPADQQAIARGDGRREIADLIVKMKLLAQEAKSRNLDRSPGVQRLLANARDQILAQAMVNDVKDKVDDAAVRKYFEAHKGRLERVQARHILIRMKGSRVPLRPGEQDLTDDQAKAKAEDIYKRLKAGADFAKIAREESDDTGSGADGGDLGSIYHGRMVQPFEEAVFALKEGEISQPVRSPFGWHVIQVMHRFDTPEKLAEQIRASLGPTETEDLIAELKKSHKTEVDDSFFGPPAPPEPTTPATTAPAAPAARVPPR